MGWSNPLELKLVPSSDSNHYSSCHRFVTTLPMPGHVGSFGYRRKHHTHEGVDLYCKANTPIWAVEDGIVVDVQQFTGQYADPPSPWWHDTQAILVEGKTGVVVYGEVISIVEVGIVVQADTMLGCVTPVLKKDKGRPMSMLHLELHEPGTRVILGWDHGSPRPKTLLDPTYYLYRASQ